MGIRNHTTKATAVTLTTIAALTAAFSGENENATFALSSPAEYAGVGPAEVVELSVEASGMVEAKQVEVVVELSPADAFDLDNSSFDPGTSPFTLAPGLDRLGGGRVRGGGASVAVAVSGDGSLGTFRFQTAAGFNDRSEASIEVILISIGPSFEIRDAFFAEQLGIRVEINPGVESIGEPSLTVVSSVDVAADPSPSGTGNALDGSRGEVTFVALFRDSTETATPEQPVSWSITNEGDEPVFLLGDQAAEIPPRSAMTAMSTSDVDGRASITLDSEGRSSGSQEGSVAPTRVTAIASTAAPNTIQEVRNLEVEFSATWDLSVPAELASFTAEVLDSQHVRLRWDTVSQSANLGWQVFRSVEGRPFTQIGGLVEGAGTTDEFLSYSFLDVDVPIEVELVSYYLRQIDVDGSGVRSQGLDVSLVPAESPIPSTFRLAQSRPNPFNPETVIHFKLPTALAVSLTIYDVTGQIVRQLLEHSSMTAGRHQATWNGIDEAGHKVSSGTYFYALRAGPFHSVARMTLLR